jgi:nitrite reductase/ring-hydroxylating ferredoxin subunit
MTRKLRRHGDIGGMSGVGRVRLCKAAELAAGEMRRFEPAGADPVLLCNLAGDFVATDDECTHAIASLSEGRIEGNIIFCPMHGGSFDLCTGKAKSLPCKHPLRTFPVEVIDGEVWVELD